MQTQRKIYKTVEHFLNYKFDCKEWTTKICIFVS